MLAKAADRGAMGYSPQVAVDVDPQQLACHQLLPPMHEVQALSVWADCMHASIVCSRRQERSYVQVYRVTNPIYHHITSM